MSCCSTRFVARDSVRALFRGGQLKQGGGAKVPVLGTWDFKWPAGSRLRVVFQRVAGETQDDLDAAAYEIETLAKTWTHTDGKQHADIVFDFGADRHYRWIDPPDDKDDVDGTAVREPKKDTYRAYVYDVLIAFNRFPRNERVVNGNRKVEPFLPFAALGSYARRNDYNVPTLQVGPLGAVGAGLLAKYYQHDALARFYVLHELGHVLGLIHEHQNSTRPERSTAQARKLIDQADDVRATAFERQAPKLNKEKRNFAAPHDVLVRFLRGGGVPLPQRVQANNYDELYDYVLDHVLVEWPGNPRFSDLRTWQVQDEGTDSIMDVPYWRCMLGLHGQTQGGCTQCDALIGGPNGPRADLRPYDGDIEQLKAMYPLRVL